MALTALSQSARTDSLSSFSVLTAILASSLSQNQMHASARETAIRADPRRISRLQQVQLRLLRFRHRPFRFFSSRLWFSLCAAGTFQMGKNLFGAIENFPGQTREAGNLNSVTF